MTKRGGKRLSRARRVSAATAAVNAVVAVGILVSLGMVCVSVMLNYRMGYHSADAEFDGMLYGAGAGFGDALKAVAPFMLHWSIRNRDWLAAVAATMLFIVCTAYSLTAGLGFAADNRAAKAGEAKGMLEWHADLRAEKNRFEERLSSLGPQRVPLDIAGEIDGLFAQQAFRGGESVRVVSAGCKRLKQSTRQRCASILALQSELARAEEAQRLSAQLSALIGQHPPQTILTADAQVDALHRLASRVSRSVAAADIGLGLTVLLALFLELGSGLGLYVATTPWRKQSEPHPGRLASKDGKVHENHAERLGDVEGFVMACVERDDAGEVGIGVLFSRYLSWCAQESLVPYRRSEFSARFDRMANAVGMRVHVRRSLPVYRGIRLA